MVKRKQSVLEWGRSILFVFSDSSGRVESRAGIFSDQEVKEWGASITPWEEEKALTTEVGSTALIDKVGHRWRTVIPTGVDGSFYGWL